MVVVLQAHSSKIVVIRATVVSCSEIRVLSDEKMLERWPNSDSAVYVLLQNENGHITTKTSGPWVSLWSTKAYRSKTIAMELGVPSSGTNSVMVGKKLSEPDAD